MKKHEYALISRLYGVFLAVFSPLGAAGEVTATAEVTVSDGLRYSATVSYRDQDHALFHRVYPDQTVTQVVDGEAVWQSVGGTESEGTPFVRLLVLGHQFHAQLLWPDEFFVSSTEPEYDEECTCMVSTHMDRFGSRVDLRTDVRLGRPIGNTTQIKGGPRIEYRYSDWRSIGAKDLPYVVDIDDGTREFRYRFSKVSLTSEELEEFVEH